MRFALTDIKCLEIILLVKVTIKLFLMRKREKIKLKRKQTTRYVGKFFKNYSCKYSEAHTKV